MSEHHPTADVAFGARVAGAAGEPRLDRREIGHLTLTTGKLVACDPLVLCDTDPFVQEVPPGRYPVEVALAHFDDGDVRVAFATLLLAPEPPVAWEPALLPGQDPAALGPDEYFGYGVDAGTGAFMDEETALALRAAFDADPGAADRIADAMEARYTPTWSWAEVLLPDAGPANAIVFSSGVGDGLYPTYVGRDAAGRPVRFLTDFQLLEPPPSEPPPPPPRRRWWRFWR